MKKYQTPACELTFISHKDIILTSPNLTMNNGLDDCRDYANWNDIFKP